MKTLRLELTPIDALRKSESESCVNLTDYSQTLCTALQVALVELLDQFGVVPRKVVGHSSGEIAAAYGLSCNPKIEFVLSIITGMRHAIFPDAMLGELLFTGVYGAASWRTTAMSGDPCWLSH